MDAVRKLDLDSEYDDSGYFFEFSFLDAKVTLERAFIISLFLLFKNH